MTRARHICPAPHARSPVTLLMPVVPAVLMPALLALLLLVLAMQERIAVDPRLAGGIGLVWSLVPVLTTALARHRGGTSALGPLTVTAALLLPFLPVEAALVTVGIALFLLALREQERADRLVLPGGAVNLAAHGVILLLAASLLLLGG